MPKRGQRGGYNNNAGGSRFAALDFDHDDDRGSYNHRKEQNSTRRVSFKPSQIHKGGGSGGGMKPRMAEMAIRSRFEDDDEMRDFPNSSKFESRGMMRRKGSPIPKGKFGKLMPSAFNWYQVTVQSGHRYPKDNVIRALLNAIAPDVFIPLYWRTEKNCVFFFVDDFHIAERLQQIERCVQMPDGYRLFTRVRGGCPIVAVDEQVKEKIKIVMAKRYNPQTRAMDLSKFHADSEFKQMFCGLHRPNIMTAVIEIIEKNVPEMEALNLNDNSLASLETFKNVNTRLPNLKILYLAENKIPSLAHLMVLRNVPIIELALKSNPLRQRYNDHSLYVSEVRRKFPKLMKLDGEQLEPQILFDIHDEAESLPQPRAVFLCDPSATDMIRQFIDQYFNIFDSGNRQPLLDAYHENAMLSISIPPASQAGRIPSFWKYNRNFRRVLNSDDNNRIRQLKVGRLAVVTTLADWPKTQHDRQNMSVDVTLYNPSIITFTLCSVFKEFDSDSTNTEIRYAQRQMTIIPTGNSLAICNELILITSASSAQVRTFMKNRIQQTSTMQQPSSSTSLQDRLLQNQASTSAAAMQMPNTGMQQHNILDMQQQQQSMAAMQQQNMAAMQQQNMAAMQQQNMAALQQQNMAALQQQNMAALQQLNLQTQSMAPVQQSSMAGMQQQQNMAAMQHQQGSMLPPMQQQNPTIIQQQNVAAVPQQSTNVGGQPDAATKMQMIQALSAASQMNIEWTKKCLEETNWEYDNAVQIFVKLQRDGNVPAEAFIKS